MVPADLVVAGAFVVALVPDVGLVFALPDSEVLFELAPVALVSAFAFPDLEPFEVELFASEPEAWVEPAFAPFDVPVLPDVFAIAKVGVL